MEYVDALWLFGVSLVMADEISSIDEWRNRVRLFTQEVGYRVENQLARDNDQNGDGCVLDRQIF